MKVFTINETTNIRNNNWVNNGFFINNIYIRVYGKNKYLGKVISVVDDYWLAEDKKSGVAGNINDALSGVTKDPILRKSVEQVNDSIQQLAKSDNKGRKYFKWYLIELGGGLGGLTQGQRKYVREDVVKVVR
jgi:hypothetical protein